MSEHSLQQRPRARIHPTLGLYAALAIVLVLPVGFGVFFAITTGVRHGQDYAFRLWAVAVTSLVIHAWIAFSAVRLFRGQRIFTDGTLQLFLGIIAAASPAIMRAVLPWEDTDTGTGSPLAAAMGIACLAIPAGVYALVVLIATGSLDAHHDECDYLDEF